MNIKIVLKYYHLNIYILFKILDNLTSFFLLFIIILDFISSRKVRYSLLFFHLALLQAVLTKPTV